MTFVGPHASGYGMNSKQSTQEIADSGKFHNNSGLVKISRSLNLGLSKLFVVCVMPAKGKTLWCVCVLPAKQFHSSAAQPYDLLNSSQSPHKMTHHTNM